MRRLALVLLCLTSMAGKAGAADCGPYVDLFDRFMHAYVAMHDPGSKPADRTGAANAVGYFLVNVYMAAKDRQLHELQDCTHQLFAALRQDLPPDADLAYNAGWAGYLQPRDYNIYGTTPDSVRKAVIFILAEAEKIAALTKEVPPVISGEPPVAAPHIEGVWHGIELTLVIQGKSQVKPLGPISLTLEADGTYRMELAASQSDKGRWHLDGSVLSLVGDQGDDPIKEYSVSFEDDLMQWQASKHDGQWLEKWVWQR